MKIIPLSKLKAEQVLLRGVLGNMVCCSYKGLTFNIWKNPNNRKEYQYKCKDGLEISGIHYFSLTDVKRDIIEEVAELAKKEGVRL